MNPTERHFMINWMLQQVSFIRTWLQRRGVSDFDPESVFFNVLQVDPATPPSGSQWSTITILTFKAWDLREKIMADFGGAKGAGLWKDSRTQVKGRHIRATPCSPQCQRKLEIPIRVLLSLINESKLLESSQVVILWKTLTIMAPQTVRAFDPQAVACARLHYFEKDGVFRARLEIADSLRAACEATPPEGSAETCMWNYNCNKVVFGVQSEIDAADKAATEAAMKAAYSSGQSARLGKTNRRWTQGFVYSSGSNPHPVEIDVVKVPQVAYCWDEYCDRMDPTKKVGDYSASTFCGPPILSAQAGRTEMAAPTWVPARSSQTGAWWCTFCSFITPLFQVRRVGCTHFFKSLDPTCKICNFQATPQGVLPSRDDFNYYRVIPPNSPCQILTWENLGVTVPLIQSSSQPASFRAGVNIPSTPHISHKKLKWMRSPIRRNTHRRHPSRQAFSF